MSVALGGTLDATLGRLGASAAALNEATDALSATVDEVNLALKRLNLGVHAEVVDRSEIDKRDEFVEVYLGYGRIGSMWGLYVKRRMGDPQGATEESWLWKDTPRALRLGTLRRLPALLNALTVEADKMADELAQNILFAKDVVAAMRSIYVADC